MYASQALVGLALSYGVRFIQGADNGEETINTQIIGMTSLLLGASSHCCGSGLIYADLVRLFYLKLDYRKALLK